MSNKTTYTKKEFDDALEKSGLKNTFGHADLALAQSNPTAGMEILKAKQDYMAAPAGEAGDMARGLARARAESVRITSGGYKTSEDGLVSQKANNKSTNTGVLSIYGTNSSGSKSTAEDSALKAYREALEKEKAKTMEDVAGQVASLTGGFGSSSAATKAAAAGLDYSVLLAEKEAEFKKKKYDESYNEAQIAASFGDYSKLEALGIDTTALRERDANDKKATALTDAYKAASIGDYSQLEALGIDTTALRESSAPKEAEPVVTKPVLSLKEAETAYNSGNKSSNVLAALKYYYGDDYFDNVVKTPTKAPQWTDNEWESMARSQEVYSLEQILHRKGNDAAYAELLKWYNEDPDMTAEKANLIAAIVGIVDPEA